MCEPLALALGVASVFACLAVIAWAAFRAMR